MQPITTDVWRDVSVCVSVCPSRNGTLKTAGPIEMPFGVWGGVGPSNHVLDGRPDPTPRETGMLGHSTTRCGVSSTYCDVLFPRKDIDRVR